uniref:restriction endonuclease subunit S n=1 Tax=Polynucleobacter sp. TaxID=2029855 RepID=UPI0040480AD4
MNKFSSYKDTNTPWIGEIPTEWSVKTFKKIFTEKQSTKNTTLGCGSISFGRVVYKDDEKIPESTKESYQEVLKGEFLINPLNLNYDLKSLRIGLSKINVVVSQGYIVLKIKDGFVPEYYEYLLRKFDVEHMKSLGQGVRQTISFTHIKDEKLVVPSAGEQKQISDYLDKKTSQIDSLISKIERRIELLKEQRTSTINQLVFKGLDPNVKMKESDIEWIRELPDHWNCLRLKLVLKGREERSETGSEELLSVTIDPGVLKRRDFLGNDEEHISRAEDLSGYKIVKKDDLVNNIMKMGFSCLGVSPYDGIVSPAYSVFKIDQNQVLPSYLHFLLRTPTYIAEYWKRSKGIQASRMRLYDDFFVDISIPIPPLEEQERIVQVINMNRSIKRIALENKRLELFKEYRQSLISSVVTGKVRVTEEMV